MQRAIIRNQADNVETYGLDVKVDFNFLGCVLTSDNAGIRFGQVREAVEVVL